VSRASSRILPKLGKAAAEINGALAGGHLNLSPPAARPRREVDPESYPPDVGWGPGERSFSASLSLLKEPLTPTYPRKGGERVKTLLRHM
jgi:hypothetical protein